jgi:glycosyltransferase involved in cell wall biosynthesis
MRSADFALTVGVPVSDAMPWLPEAIESLLRQTTDDFVILAIVDGGSDGSAAYLRKMRDSGLHPRLRILEQQHQGVTATLNRLLRETPTPWLARMDADDVSYPHRIEKLLCAIGEHSDAGLIYSLADYHPQERCTGRFRCSRGSPSELRSIVESGYLLSICHSTVALNVEKAQAVGGYRMDIHAEDADLWWRIARRFEIQCIPETLVGFRQSAASVSARNLDRQELAGMYVQYLLLSELWGLKPRPLAEVARVLLSFVKPSTITAKEALRRFNMHLSQSYRWRAAAALAQAAWASPGYLLGRVRDEFRRSSIFNGVEPHLFWERRDTLWIS